RKTLRFIPQADLRILDPVWTSAYITQHHAYLVYDTLFALDEQMKPQPQMIDRWTLSDDNRKVVKFDRIEWIYIPDSATAAAALNNGEVDWWELVPTELVPVLAANKSVVVNKKPDPLGTLGLLRFNQLQPPFNNEKMRQAFLYAVD